MADRCVVNVGRCRWAYTSLTGAGSYLIIVRDSQIDLFTPNIADISGSVKGKAD